MRPGAGGIEDVAGRVVVEGRPHRVLGDVVIGISHDPQVGAADPDAGVGRGPDEGDLVQEQGVRIAAGGDQVQAQVCIAGVDDVDRDVEGIQAGGVGDRHGERQIRRLALGDIKAAEESAAVLVAERVVPARRDRVGHELALVAPKSSQPTVI